MPKNNYASKQEVRWCPGCGDYAILANLQRTFAKLEIPNENLVFISGIGCSGRLPYYMDVNGFHTIHGRAPTIATGVKLARPDLSVWVVTGDGDGFSIGTNHILHLARRNLDINVLILNNQVYGLTKGQYSPTSNLGQISKSSPQGAQEKPFEPLELLAAGGGTFLARGVDTDAVHMQSIFEAAYQHKGTSFIEIYQNCPIFNDTVFENIRDKKKRADNAKYITAEDCKDTLIPDIRARKPVNLGIFQEVKRKLFESQQNQHCAKQDIQSILSGVDSWQID